MLKGPVYNLGHRASTYTPRHPVMEFAAAAANLSFGDKLVVASKRFTSSNHPTMALTASSSFFILALVTSVWYTGQEDPSILLNRI